MKACILLFLASTALAAEIVKVTDLIKDAPWSKCECCYPPCCCKCAQCVTEDKVFTLPPSTTPIPTTTTTGVIECNNTLDLVFIVDSSGSISSDDWIIVKDFIWKVVQNFDIGFKDTRVGLITYSNNASLEWDLNSKATRNKKNLEDAIMGVEQVGGFTNTVEGLELAMTSVFGQKGDRKNTPNAAVVLTDGRGNFREWELEEIARQLQELSPVVAIGVTKLINMTELGVIATGDNGENVFNVDTFEDLENILQSLVKTVCEEIPTRPPPDEKQPRTTRAPEPGKIEEQCICVCPQPKYDKDCEDCPTITFESYY